MTDQKFDALLSALLAEPEPEPDSVFAEHVIALARHDLAVRRARRRALEIVGMETLALAAVIAAFIVLARAVPEAAGFGDVIDLASPAMLGLIMLALYGLVGMRPAASER
jgi:hypothetical protein